MKKLVLSILTCLYMTVSSGIAMEIHYCMGKRAGVDFYKTENEKCGRCGMKDKKGGCCNDEYKFYKLADAHKNISNDHNFGVTEIALIPEYNVYSSIVFNTVAVYHPLNNSPPEDTGVPIFIRNCVFRL